ncbi:MAG: hypothetical protein QGG09_22360 [Pirellulaceae bacterium]|nr:hypothetical protein [Pirellulaceae bacterium]HJN11961.1 hypothetical protein [Pirellulaceae bacterium]
MNWDSAPLVFVTAIHCPHCLGLRPISVRSAANGDGSTTRRYVCRECSRRFVLVVELPEFGRAELDDE